MKKKEKIKGGTNNNLALTIILIIIVAFCIFVLIYNKNSSIKTIEGYS